MRPGVVERVHIASESGDSMQAVDSAEAVADRGLRGDRYFTDDGLWNTIDENPDHDVTGASDVTFVELEALAAVEADVGVDLEPGIHRRNVTTSGVALNHLVGSRFTVGEAMCEGIELCEPCGYMQALADVEGLSEALVHRGGLNARVVRSGNIAVGNEIRW